MSDITLIFSLDKMAMITDSSVQNRTYGNPIRNTKDRASITFGLFSLFSLFSL